MATESLPLVTAGISADPTSGVVKQKVDFSDNSTVYDYIQEVKQSTVGRYIQEVADDGGYYIDEEG